MCGQPNQVLGSSDLVYVTQPSTKVEKSNVGFEWPYFSLKSHPNSPSSSHLKAFTPKAKTTLAKCWSHPNITPRTQPLAILKPLLGKILYPKPHGKHRGDQGHLDGASTHHAIEGGGQEGLLLGQVTSLEVCQPKGGAHLPLLLYCPVPFFEEDTREAMVTHPIV
jgi:hypothetical protein